MNRRNRAFTMWNTATLFGWQESSDPAVQDIPFFYRTARGKSVWRFLDNTWRSVFDYWQSVAELFSFGGGRTVS